MKCKQIWNGRTWVKKELCENAHTNTDVNFGNGVGVTQCYDNPAQFSVTVHYTDCLGQESEKDTMRLCGDCSKALKKSARKHGYRIETIRI